MYNTNSKGGWDIPDGTKIPDGTEIPKFSTLGDGCSLGDYCKLGDCCSLGDYCSLGYGCSLGDGCTWLGITVIKWMTCANVDGSGRQLKIIRHKDGIKIEAGCFRGSHIEFLEKANSENKNTYVAIVGAICGAMM